jgi:hypothetical protein
MELQAKVLVLQAQALQEEADEHAAKRARVEAAQEAVATEFSPEFMLKMAEFLKKHSG